MIISHHNCTDNSIADLSSYQALAARSNQIMNELFHALERGFETVTSESQKHLSQPIAPAKCADYSAVTHPSPNSNMIREWGFTTGLLTPGTGQ